MMFRYYLMLCLLYFSFAAIGKVVIYTVPKEINASNNNIHPSEEYRIEVLQNGVYVPFVYSMNAMHITNNCKTTAWVNFSFSGKITVKVKKLKGDVQYCAILPKSKNITPTISSNEIIFNIDTPGHYSVEFQKGVFIEHPLLIFANPLETNVPDKSDPNTIYFEDGYHDIGPQFVIPSNKRVYVSGGAYIKGQFYAEKATGINITGRGIVSGEAFPARTADHMIVLRQVSRARIEGITIIHAPRYMISVTGDSSHIENVKMIGWWFSTDGISCGDHSVIENCFFKVNDDAIKLYASHMMVKNNVIWQMENGAPFMISWNGSRDFGHIKVINNDVIRVEHEWDNENLAVVCAVHGGKAHISDLAFDDLRIDNSVWRAFHIVTRPNRWGKWDQDNGSISDIAFTNITYYGHQMIKSIIIGHDKNHPISNISFQNMRFGGKIVNDLSTIVLVDKEHSTNIALLR